jgi:hypothetical protein
MKRIFLLLPLLLVVASITAFSRLNNSVDPRTEQVFKTEFAGAANVTWSKEGDFLKVSFTWAGHQAVAYFTTDAKLVGCIRGLFFNQLPLTVIRSVERNFKTAVIIEIREISNDEGISYRLALEYKNKKHKIRLNSFGDILENEKLK